MTRSTNTARAAMRGIQYAKGMLEKALAANSSESTTRRLQEAVHALGSCSEPQLPWHALLAVFTAWEYFLAEHPEGGPHMEGSILFSSASFDAEYSEELRTYEISSYEKLFRPGMSSRSLHGFCRADGDRPRLDRYMAEIYGGDDGWSVQYATISAPGEEV